MKYSSLPLLAAFALLTLPTLAATESFTFTLPTTDLTSGSVNDSFTLGAFDPTLGTLTNVSLSLDLTTVASPQILNISGGTQGYANARTSFTTVFTGPDGSFVSFTTHSAVDNGQVNGAQFTTTTLTGNPVGSSSSSAVIGSLASYTGTSPINFTLVAPQNPGFTSSGSPTGPGNLAFGGTGSVGGTATVQYTYLSAPEPSSWALLLIALGILGFAMYRRRANA